MCHLPKNKFPLGYDFNLNKVNFPIKEQVYLGMISLVDPPRESVPYSVLKCKAAGIKVIMITGD